MTHIAQIVSYLVLIGVSSLLYRLGGMAKTGTWYDFLCKSITRDAGVTILTILTMVVLGRYHWSLWLCFPLIWGALSTYWDWLFDGEDNFYMHGFMIGIAMLPLVFYGYSLIAIGIRAVILMLVMGILNYLANKYNWKHSDWIEECSRGAIIAGTLWIV